MTLSLTDQEVLIRNSVFGLILDGVVTAVPGANQFTIPSLAGLGVGKFMGATNPFYAFVIMKGTGTSAAPQGEQQPITAYNNTTGAFTTAAFTVAVAAGDEILILQPDLVNAPVVADLDVPGVDSANNVLERDVIGNKTDSATPDDMSALATSSLVREVKRVLLRMAPAAFTATIQGATPTNLAAMLGTMATYFKAAGAAFSATIGGAAKTDIEAAFTALAAYFNAASAALSVVSQPGVAARTNLNAITQDLADILAGAGITNFPAGAAAAGGVSIAGVIRYIQENLVAPQVAGRVQEPATTIDLNQAAGDYTLFTGTSQPVLIESFIIKMPNAVAGGALLSIQVHTDDTTPKDLIPALAGAVANLTAENQLIWTGKLRIDVGKHIVLTIAGGATGVAYVCTVNAECKAVVAGGHLA